MKLGTTNTTTLRASSAQAPGTVNSTAEEVGEFTSVVIYSDVSAVTLGTGGTLDVRLQDSPDNTIWVDIPSAAFAQSTATGTRRLVAQNIGQYIRTVSIVGGTGSSFTHTVKVVGIR